MTDTLHLPLKGEYFDQIEAGTKPEEYRLVTPFWTKRIMNRSYKWIRLTRGYPKRDDFSRIMILPWLGYKVRRINHPHFGSDSVQVYAVDVSGPCLNIRQASEATG